MCVNVASFILSHGDLVSLQHVCIVVVCLNRLFICSSKYFCRKLDRIVRFVSGSISSFITKLPCQETNILLTYPTMTPCVFYVHALHVCCFNFECFRGMQSWQRRRRRWRKRSHSNATLIPLSKHRPQSWDLIKIPGNVLTSETLPQVPYLNLGFKYNFLDGKYPVRV